MIVVLKILVTVLSSVCGGYLFRFLRIPTPMLTGGIVGVSVCTLLFPGVTFFPAGLKTVVQICSGAVIGSRVSRKEVRELKWLVFPAIILVTCLLLFNLVSAIGMYYAGIRDVPTAMFCSAPGGMADMTIMSADFGADPIYVAVIQFCRLLFVNATFPSLIHFINEKKLYPGPARAVMTAPLDSSAPDKESSPLLLTIPAAAAGGVLFKTLGVPSGAILGAAVFTALLNLRYERIYMPQIMKYAVQLGIGCYVGVQMVRDSLYIIREAALPVLVLLLASLIYTYLCALLIYRVSRFDFAACMLMCSPGGLNEMSIIADEMGTDAPKVAVMHSIRIICIVAFFYRIIPLLEMILN